ncbi:MAG: HD domain-containing protein [Patescibacteria group bacterium]|nr:HD domain-containing protein [Patescibacteria group bacterium]
MLVEDRLYGKVEIDSPILVELINSPAIQRLKGINQLGVPAEFYPFPSFSRYEHSIGVMLLLRRLGASEEEQIAGLLHDASHTAFSHVIDWVLKEIGGQESYQDENHLIYLKRTELPSILESFGYDVEAVADHHRFCLLERDIPNLCADRVDYSLREFPDDVSQACLSGLSVNNGFITFNDKRLAKLFAENFLERQKLNWGGFEAVNRYYYFAKALRIAMELGLVKFEDFYMDDGYVMDLIKDCPDEEFKKIMSAMKEKCWANRPQTGRRMEKKVRYVDPLCVSDSGLQNLSELDNDFKNKLEEELALQKPGVPIVII